MNGIARVVLLLAGTSTLCGCVCWDNHHHLYATDLDPRDGPYVVAWPAGADGAEFRYLVEPGAGELKDLGVRTVAPDGFDPPGDVAAAIVVLPPDTDPALRERANAMLAAVTAANPGAGTHVVTDSARWDRVRHAEDVIRRIYRMRTTAAKRRPFPGSWTDAIAKLFLASFHSIRRPDAIVVPLAGHADRFLVATGLPVLNLAPTTVEDLEVIELDRSGVLTQLREWQRPPSDADEEELRAMGRDMGFDLMPTILLLRPRDLPAGPAAEFDALLTAAAASPGARVVTQCSGVPYGDLGSADAFREALDAAAIPFARLNLLCPQEDPGE